MASAEAKLFAAQEALRDAQAAYDAALGTRVALDLEIANAQQSLAAAQAAYAQSQIPDPSWTRPLVEESYSVTVPYPIQAPYTLSEPVITQVPRVIQVPQTSIVERTTRVANTTYTISGGVTAKVYNRRGYNNAPPLPSENETPVLTTTVSNVNFQWGGGYIMNTNLHDDVLVKFTGNLMVPADGSYQFFAPADDGVILDIAGMALINDWYDKGGGGSVSEQRFIRAGVLYPFTLYYYENGGGAWVQFNAKLVSDSQFQVIPESWLGSQVQETTTYEDVITSEEVTTYIEETVYDDVTTMVDVIYYREETAYRDEQRIRMVPDQGAQHPNINDPGLLSTISDAESKLNNLNSLTSQSSIVIEEASSVVFARQEDVGEAQQGLESIPEFVEPTLEPTLDRSEPEPTEEVDSDSAKAASAAEEMSNLVETPAEDLTDAQVEQLVEAAMVVFETAEQGSAAYEQALEALAVAADADDSELPSELAAIPLLGDVAGAVFEAFNDLGNVGADMAPKVRETAEETILATVIAAGAAINAVQSATTAAATAAATTSGSSGASAGASGGASGSSARRKE